MDTPLLTIDGFARSIGVNKDSPHALVLGAGASLTSGVPTASSCVNEWKRSIFVTNNPALRDHVAEITLPSVRKRIDGWLKANGYWPADGGDDYGYFIEKCHPIADDRRRFFEPWIREARPHIGYQLLCLLAESQVIKSVWTTNFDGLVAKAAATTSVVAVEIGIDSQHRSFRQPSRSELLCVSLHGDYRYDNLANTPDELRKQEEQLKRSLVETLKTHSLIVSGYSGRDASLMRALEDAVGSTAGPTKVYWCGYDDSPSPAVAALIEKARCVGRDAFYVPGASFDDLMTRLAMTCVAGDLGKRATAIIGSADSDDLPKREPFASIQSAPTGLLKSNALPIRCPSEVFAFDLVEWPSEKVWQWLSDMAAPHKVVAVPFKQVLALGTLDGIRTAFDGNVKGKIQRVPLSERDLQFEDGAVTSLLLQSLVLAIAAKRGLETDGRRRLWESQPVKTERENAVVFKVHRAIVVALRTIGGRVYLTIDPTFHVPLTSDDDKADADNIRKRLLGYQHNKDFNADLDFWRKFLCPTGADEVYDFPPSSAAFEFTLSAKPAYAAITMPHRQSIQLAPNVQPLVHHRGMVCEEPRLLFATAPNGRAYADVMPLRGLATKGPFDQALSSQPYSDRIRISVVCPKAESGILEAFLSGIDNRWSPQRQDKEEYLVPYPGFEQAFRVPLQIPKRTDVNWFTLPEIDPSRDQESGARELARNINDAIRAAATTDRSVVLILTPARWDRWRGFESEHEAFDVHDFVKAYAVQRGISTQFLKQEKLDIYDKCRFWWWFSLALYAKAMRTPWVLEGLDANSAYVGLGYAIDTKAARGQQIVLGCSHLYNSHGQGLQFRLSRIENPTIRGGNPYLSFDDARRMGETIRSLFWDSQQRLPERVVVHKLFPFRFDELKGLRAGLEGVRELELLEINHESRLRYLSSKVVQGGFAEDNYPVRRGTALRLTDREALLWVHGSTDAVKPNWTYFQGKRRIPGPLVVRRYAGTSSLSSLSTEILGLSKMDWNSGDLYSQLPATVQSSKSIAQIGALLERFGAESFDYRLFM